MRKLATVIAILFAAGLTSSRAQNSWTQKADFGGIGRVWAVGFSIGDKGYLGTGFNYDFWEYDPANDAWTQKADYSNIEITSATGFSIGSKGYIGTGHGAGLDRTDFWEYDPASNVWTQKANFGGIARGHATGFSIGNKGYIGLGQTQSGPSYKDFWEYDSATDTWTQKADFGGTARYGTTGFSIGSKGYVGTGYDGSLKNDFWEFNPATNVWTQKANFGGSARDFAVGFSIGTNGYIGTGVDGATTATTDFWQYNPATDTWIQKADFGGSARGQAVGFAIGGSGYIGTGALPFFAGKKDFWQYSEDLSLTTGSISGSPFCPETAVSVSFTATGTFNAGNTYTAQLSDKMGSFASPTTIGTLSSTANSGTIAATLPSKPKAGTKYRIRVVSSNPAFTGTDNGTNLQLIACDKVTGFLVTGITSTAATVNWIGVSCAVKYKVQYRKQGTTKWTSKYSTTISYTITGLSANTVYEYRVQTWCTESGSAKSGFTSILTFSTTLRLGAVSDSPVQLMSIYPNPTEVFTTLHFTLIQASHLSIKVFDLSGREIALLLNDDMQEGDHSLQINTTKFSKGIYMIQMISDAGTENQKLIVQ